MSYLEKQSGIGHSEVEEKAANLHKQFETPNPNSNRLRQLAKQVLYEWLT